MVYAVIGTLAFQNTARRNSVHSNIEKKLSPTGMFGDPILLDRIGLSIHDTSGDPALYVEVRFLAQADRDAFYDDVVAALSGVNGPVTGSWVEKHTCSHDEAVHSPCVETERQTY